MCICPGCEFMKYPGSRFCSEADRKRGYDNLVYQRRMRKDISDKSKESFDLAMKSDEVAGKEVLDFCRDNPPELRKKGLVDFAKFDRIRGMKVSASELAGDIPMTERAFLKHCENVLGLTDEEAAECLVLAAMSLSSHVVALLFPVFGGWGWQGLFICFVGIVQCLAMVLCASCQVLAGVLQKLQHQARPRWLSWRGEAVDPCA